jgi:tRNA(Ile)-lysidine synthase TilS/MesJ
MWHVFAALSGLSAIRRLTIKHASGNPRVGGSAGLRAMPARQNGVIKNRRSGRYRHDASESLREPSLQKLTEFRRSLELRNRIEFLERRREGIRETPDRSRSEFVVLRFEVKLDRTPSGFA